MSLDLLSSTRTVTTWLLDSWNLRMQLYYLGLGGQYRQLGLLLFAKPIRYQGIRFHHFRIHAVFDLFVVNRFLPSSYCGLYLSIRQFFRLLFRLGSLRYAKLFFWFWIAGARVRGLIKSPDMMSSYCVPGPAVGYFGFDVATFLANVVFLP